MRKRLLAVFMVLVLVLAALAGCGNKTEEPAAQNGSETPSQSGKQESEKAAEPAEPEGPKRNTTASQAENSIRVKISYDITTLDDNHAVSGDERIIINLIYDRLMRKNAEGGWDPVLVTGMEPNEDGSVVECEIRDDISFASGDKMTMEDIVYSFERCNMSGSVLYVYDNSYIEVVDDTHFRWHFPNPDYDFYTLEDQVKRMTVFNKSFCEQFCGEPTDDLLLNTDGTGPYKLEGPLSAGLHDVTLVRNELSWERPAIDKVYFRYISGDSEMAFESGDIDYSTYKATDLSHIEEMTNVSIATQRDGSTFMMILNCSEASPFHDIKVREAFQYSFERETVGLVVADYSGEAAWNLFAPDCQYWADVCPHRDLDIAKAKALMAEAGYSESSPCDIVLFGLSDPAYLAALEVLKEDLDKCGFNCGIEEAAELTRYMTGDFDAAIIAVGFDNIFGLYGMLFDMSTGMDLALYDEEDAADIAAMVSQANDEESAKQAMLAVDAAMCYIPLAYDAVFFASDSNLDMGPYIDGYNIRFMSWKD